MSIQHINRPDGTIGDLVTCDECGARMHEQVIDWGEWDWSWQKLYVDISGSYVDKHLCARCRTQVVWCDECRTFHYKNSTHRVQCERCGRTYSAFVNRPGRICANCANEEGENTSHWWLRALTT